MSFVTRTLRRSALSRPLPPLPSLSTPTPAAASATPTTPPSSIAGARPESRRRYLTWAPPVPVPLTLPPLTPRVRHRTHLDTTTTRTTRATTTATTTSTTTTITRGIADYSRAPIVPASSVNHHPLYHRSPLPNPQFSSLPTPQSSRRRTMASSAAETTSTTTDAQATEAGVTEESLQKKLARELEAQHVVVQDISGGCGQSFEAVIVSTKFEKKTSLARHRLVNAALRLEIAAIHAWTPKCYTPAEWEKKNGGNAAATTS